MTRRMKPKDWNARCQHLADGRDYLATVRADKSKRHLLDRAVWCAWSFGEFAINVCLELRGEKVETHHDQAERAIALHTDGFLKNDYPKILEQLERYRREADFDVYSKSEIVH